MTKNQLKKFRSKKDQYLKLLYFETIRIFQIDFNFY